MEQESFEFKCHALREPFPAGDLEWRVQRSGVRQNGEPWAIVVPYITSRAIMDRLDEVMGPENWRNEFGAGPAGGVVCGLWIRGSNNEWCGKFDGADNTDIEPIKGGLTGAFKRAAVVWGIGRYLYSIPEGFAVFVKGGVYRDKIKDEYYEWNPPILPALALPETEKVEEPTKPAGDALMKALQDAAETAKMDGRETQQWLIENYGKPWETLLLEERKQAIAKLGSEEMSKQPEPEKGVS